MSEFWFQLIPLKTSSVSVRIKDLPDIYTLLSALIKHLIITIIMQQNLFPHVSIPYEIKKLNKGGNKSLI